MDVLGLNEEATAVRVEGDTGAVLERYQATNPGDSGDWVDSKSGLAYDGCSPAPNAHFEKSFNKYTKSLDEHVKHPTVDRVVIDVTDLNLSPEQTTKLDEHIASLPASEPGKIVKIGF